MNQDNGDNQMNNGEKECHGLEVRQFYEAVVNVKPTTKVPSTNVSRRTNKNKVIENKTSMQHLTFKPPINENSLLTHAQNGNLNEVKDLIDAGCDIEHSDTFGWTALMCAAYSGHLPVVKYLVNAGSNTKRKDFKGMTALYYARENNNQECSAFLNEILPNRKSRRAHAQLNTVDATVDKKHKATTVKKVYCNDCRIEYECESESDTSHVTSTAHLFNSRASSTVSQFQIPQNNVGYQMMVKSGWDEDSGLGSQEQGNKAPVKTVLKRDRCGLGYGTKNTLHKAKVTHFASKDVKSVISQGDRNGVDKKTKKAIEKQQAREKDWERRMREYMNSD